jgi:hypothetical protein
MDTDYGNRVIDGLVIAAKQLGWSSTEVNLYLDDISTVRGLHGAGSYAVKRNVYDAILLETV